ncbi:endonuclease/exonuclease/phosphatase family protein [Ancylostoma duodenale]|uniref:Endonuclease/exonuclease/phosphatase family protein n=1 Tax=Ancylostoma duodenale TaxID=51022 RepID=A0A0C2H567_9BILA|nr:endonuclease/exonuclease/phosphatase family protein [Ancylostoma duodenale]
MFQPQDNLIHVATLNVRRLCTRDRLVELQEALKNTYVDILAVTELCWKGTGIMDLHDSDYRFFYAGPEDNKGPSGTGFLVSARMLPFIDTFQREDDRISRLDVRIGKHVIRFLSIYAPPSSVQSAEDQENYIGFLDKLEALLQNSNTRKSNSKRRCCRQVHPLLLGDFNAKLGKKENEFECSVGPHGYDDQRNERGQLVVDFCEQLRLRAVASFFKTRSGRKWTWRSPDGKTLNCIDHIFACTYLQFKSVRTGSIQFETDHRLLRGHFDATSAALSRNRNHSFDAT